MEQATETEVQRLLPCVSAQRRGQALRYKHLFGQFCCLKSWMMLSRLLSERPVIDYGNWEYNEYGKPHFPQNLSPITHHPCFFSISHCKEGIAVVIDDRPIGIDIEAIRHADPELIARTMSTEEQLVIKDDRDFTRLWTRKEAVVKYLGTGIEGFEQLQDILSKYPDVEIETVEREKYIYSIAYKS